jgi:epoxyqueuosine reductase
LSESLTVRIKHEARRLGFSLVGVTFPEEPAHYALFQEWLARGFHGSMNYLTGERAERRKDLRLLLEQCESILVLGIPYSPPHPGGAGLKIASYAWGKDYHLVLPERMKQLVEFIESAAGYPVPNRWYTDTGPLLEREMGQRAGLGWIGRNSCLIHPRLGSTFFLAELLLGIRLEPDPAFMTDHCGSCRRCIEACPTGCILDNRTIDARRCISYLTIELKDDIPDELRPLMGDWVFGCDICQQVCPWNRFAQAPEPVFQAPAGIPLPVAQTDLSLTPEQFNRKFKDSPVKRARRRGFLRNIAVALANAGQSEARQVLEEAREDEEPMVRRHANWAIRKLEGGK